jgi:hypothetical protein
MDMPSQLLDLTQNVVVSPNGFAALTFYVLQTPVFSSDGPAQATMTVSIAPAVSTAVSTAAQSDASQKQIITHAGKKRRHDDLKDDEAITHTCWELQPLVRIGTLLHIS